MYRKAIFVSALVASSAWFSYMGWCLGSGSRVDEVRALEAEVAVLQETINTQSKELEECASLSIFALEPTPKICRLNIKKVTRGVRNRNPGNVHALSSKNPWLGQIGKDKGGSAIFATFEHGLLAQYSVIRSYYEKHNIRTLLGLTSRYCEGDAIKYAKFIGKQIGVSDITRPIDFLHYMPGIMKAMVRFENGWDIFPDEYYIPYSKRGGHNA